MAIHIEFEGYVNEVKTFDWGIVAKVAHSQRAKNDTTGQWETVGKDYFDVTLPEGVTVNEGDIVAVRGNMKASGYLKNDGTAGVGMKVRASSVSKIDRGRTEQRNIDPDDARKYGAPF